MQDFYLAGYKLLIPTKRYEHMDTTIVPDYFISASECMSNILVDRKNINFSNGYGILDASDEGGKKCLELYMSITKLNVDEIIKLNKDITEYHQKGKFGIDGSFTDSRTAIKIYKNHFTHLNNVKLISIGVNKEVYNYILEDNTMDCRTGIYKCIKNKSKIIKGKFLGYEIIGDEFNYTYFHTILCNGLEKDIYKKFGYTLNNNGLLDKYSHAETAATYICEKELGEPVTWQPVALFENELK